MHRYRTLFLSGATLLTLVTTPILAQNNYYTTDATINTTVPGDVYVGIDAASNRSSPTVNLVTGGHIGGFLVSLNSSIVNISGGSIGNNLFANDSSMVTVSGGSVTNDFYAYFNSTLDFIGTGLTAHRQGTTTINGFTYNQYLLSGNLSDGTSVNGKSLYLQQDSNARSNLVPVPEPSLYSWGVVLAMGGAGLFKRRRRKIGSH